MPVDSDFDPDAFLAGTAVAEPPPDPDAFDPDAFLAEPIDSEPFNPDAFLAEKDPGRLKNVANVALPSLPPVSPSWGGWNPLQEMEMGTDEPESQVPAFAVSNNPAYRIPAALAGVGANTAAGLIYGAGSIGTRAGSDLSAADPDNTYTRWSPEDRKQQAEKIVKAIQKREAEAKKFEPIDFRAEYEKGDKARRKSRDDRTKQDTLDTQTVMMKEELRKIREADESAALMAQIEGSPGTEKAQFFRDVSERAKDDYGVDRSKDAKFSSKLIDAAASVSVAMAAPIVAPVTIAGMMAESGRQDAELKGATLEDQQRSMVLNAGVGLASEALLGVPALLRSAKAAKISSDVFGKIFQAGRQFALGARREGAQEGIEKLTENFVANAIVGYDPERKTFHDVPESVFLGTLVGGSLSAVVHAASPPSDKVESLIPPAEAQARAEELDLTGNPKTAAAVRQAGVPNVRFQQIESSNIGVAQGPNGFTVENTDGQTILNSDGAPLVFESRAAALEAAQALLAEIKIGPTVISNENQPAPAETAPSIAAQPPAETPAIPEQQAAPIAPEPTSGETVRQSAQEPSTPEPTPAPPSRIVNIGIADANRRVVLRGEIGRTHAEIKKDVSAMENPTVEQVDIIDPGKHVFIGDDNKPLDRIPAWKVAEAAGQIPEETLIRKKAAAEAAGKEPELDSEDLFIPTSQIAEGTPAEIPIAEITTSDIPTFKADPAEPLPRKFDRSQAGTGPIQLWRRLSGALEAISGRRRFDLAQRSGERTIPAQIHDEAKGFNEGDAVRLDAELNIRDDRGTVADYARYFRESGLTEKTANDRGLLAGGKGKAGFRIARGATEQVFALHNKADLTDAQAEAIAEAAPGNEAAQRAGVQAVMDGKTLEEIRQAVSDFSSSPEPAKSDIPPKSPEPDPPAQPTPSGAPELQQLRRELEEAEADLNAARGDDDATPLEIRGLERTVETRKRKLEFLGTPPPPSTPVKPEPSSPPPPPTPEATALKEAVVNDERAKRNLDPVVKEARITNPDMMAKAEAVLDANPNAADEIIQKLRDSLPEQRVISRIDDGVLLIQKRKLVNQRDAAGDIASDPKGTPEQRELAKRDWEAAENQISELDQAAQESRSVWGGWGQFRQRALAADFTFEALERKARAAKQEPLTPAESAKLKSQADEIARLEKKLQESEDAINKEKETKGVAEVYARTLKDMGIAMKAAAKEGKTLLQSMKEQAEASRKALREQFGITLNMNLNPTGLFHITRIGAYHIANGAVKLAEWTAKVKADLTAKLFSQIETQLPAIFEGAKKLLESTAPIFTKKKGKPKVEPTTVEAIARAKAEFVAMEELSQRTVYELARAHINAGVRGDGPVMVAVHKDLVKIFPDITERDIRRAFTDYGKVKFPSQAADKVQLRELRVLWRLQESIDRMREGLDAMKTGPQRDKASKAVRDKTSILTELLKRTKTAPSPEKLAGRAEQRQNALRNEIADLDKQLRTGEKPVKGAPALTTVQTEQLIAERDAMKAKLEEIEEEENPGMTPAERKNARDIKKAEESIADLNRRIETGELETVPQEPPIVSPELEALRSERDAMNRQLQDMRKAAKPKVSEADQQIEALSEIRNRLSEVLSGKRVPTASQLFRPLTNAAEDIKAEILAMRELLAQLKRDAKPPKDPDAARQKAQIKALESAISMYEEKIAAGDFGKKGKRHGPDAEVIAALKGVRDARRKVYEALRDAGKPVRTKAEIYNSVAALRIAKEMAVVQARIASGDYSKAPKPVKPELTKENIAARAELQKLKRIAAEGKAEFERARRTLPKRAIDAVGEAYATMRAILTGGEFSALLRQGKFGLLTHPFITFGKAVPAMFSAFKSEANEGRIMAALWERDNAKNGLYKEAGLKINNPADFTAAQLEGNYRSRWANKIPLVAGTGRSYTTYINVLRAHVFDALHATLVSREGGATKAEAKVIATFVNEMTGTGSLGVKANLATGVLNAVFFAPKFLASRFQMAAHHALWMGGSTRATQKLIAQEYSKIYLGLGLYYALLIAAFNDEDDPKPELDARSSDFLKVRVGDTSIDPLAGVQQAVVFATRLATGETKTRKGKIKPLRPLGGKKLKFGERNMTNVIADFVRTKLSPGGGFALDQVTGTDFKGDPLVTSERISNLKPITWGTIVETMKVQGVSEGTALSLMAFFGEGVNTFTDKKKK